MNDLDPQEIVRIDDREMALGQAVLHISSIPRERRGPVAVFRHHSKKPPLLGIENIEEIVEAWGFESLKAAASNREFEGTRGDGLTGARQLGRKLRGSSDFESREQEDGIPLLRRRDVRDALVLSAVAAASFVVTTWLQLYERISAFVLAHGAWRLDDLIMLCGIMTGAFVIYGFRRYHDLSEAMRERRDGEDEVLRLGAHDPVTGLPNGPALSERIEAAFADVKRGIGSFAVICVDLDHFSGVNERFGRAAGDKLLKSAADRVKAAGDGSFVARIGGDEFFLISENGEQPRAAETLANRVRQGMAEEFDVSGRRLSIGVTGGVAVSHIDGEDEVSLVANARAALRRAKREKRGSFCFFDASIDAQRLERVSLLHDLRQAMEAGQFELNYQPLARIDGEVFGFEALARWRHPVYGMLPPSRFINLIEESGLINAFGEWALREACREAASWARPLLVAVNISPRHFQSSHMIETVKSTLRESGLSGERLEIEVTENTVLSNPSRVLETMREIRALGVAIAMDDFGKGHSSLSALHSFPFNTIKIDMEFVENLGRMEQSLAIVRAILSLGRNLRIPVIAEGVETEAQRSILRKEGCENIQGYLIGRPQPIEKYAHLTSAVGVDLQGLRLTA